MIKVVWKYSKSYFFVFISLILMTVVKDMLLVVAPKFIFDSMQYGTSIEDIFIPIISYVTLYLGIHLILYFLTYARNILEEKIKTLKTVHKVNALHEFECSSWKQVYESRLQFSGEEFLN